MKLHPVVWFRKFSAVLLAVMKPLGIWGLGGLALLDSAMIPIPGGLDGVLTFYVRANPKLFVLYSLMGAAAAAVGSLVPFYIGRAGGELFLLKRINRERYERLRDRFERQEFLAIMIPSLGPPPTPLKVFQFAAGVFEMKPVLFLMATFLGKLVQFLVWSFLLIWFGDSVIRSIQGAFRNHLAVTVSVAIVLLVLIAIWMLRKVFDRRKGVVLPVEENEE